jgi:hypothetical protein
MSRRAGVAPMAVPSAHRAAWLRHDPTDWRAGTLDRARLHAEADRLRASANFAGAPERFATTVLSTFETHWLLNKLMREAPRFALIAMVMYLHHRRGRGEPGVTYSRIKALFEAGSDSGVLASPTRIKAMLALARVGGQLRVVPGAESDRRMRLLEPTDRMIRPGLRWLASVLEVTAALVPVHLAPDAIGSDADFLGEFMAYQVGAYHHDRFVLYEAFPAMQWLMARETGYMLAMELARTLSPPSTDTARTASASIAGIAKRFAVSRGTVRNLLAGCLEHGWIVSIGRGGHDIAVSPALAEQLERWVAIEIVWTAGLANAAAVALQRVAIARDGA